MAPRAVPRTHLDPRSPVPDDSLASPPQGPMGASRAWAVASHLTSLVDVHAAYYVPIGWLPPLLIWLTFKDKDAFVERHGRESLHFQVSLLLLGTAAWLLRFHFVGAELLVGLWLYKLAWVVVAAVRAAQGERFRYRLTWRFLGDTR